MDGFHYYDLFATKGIEYLLTIVFFLLLIPFWKILNGKVPVAAKAHSTVGARLYDILKIPQGIFYNPNHTWAFLEKSGKARVGLDEFLLHIAGPLEVKNLTTAGQKIQKGDILAELHHDGKQLNVHSPLSGKVLGQNTAVDNQPASTKIDPYEKGWLVEMQPSRWKEEMQSFFLADQATQWIKTEMERLKDFIATTTEKYSPSPSLVTLQDGGEIQGNILPELPKEAWEDFQHNFLDSK